MEKKKIIINSSIVLREEFDNWAILFDPDTEKIFSINPVSVLIWKLLNGKHTTDDIVNKLQERCENMPKDCAKFVNNFISELIKEGLAEYTN